MGTALTNDTVWTPHTQRSPPKPKRRHNERKREQHTNVPTKETVGQPHPSRNKKVDTQRGKNTDDIGTKRELATRTSNDRTEVPATSFIAEEEHYHIADEASEVANCNGATHGTNREITLDTAEKRSTGTEASPVKGKLVADGVDGHPDPHPDSDPNYCLMAKSDGLADHRSAYLAEAAKKG